MIRFTEMLADIYPFDAIKELLEYSDNFIEESIKRRQIILGCKTQTEYFEIIKTHSIELQHLLHSLENNYSEFFRNPLTFSVVEQIIIPSLYHALRQKQRELRIWSVACSAGQEVYSTAILLEEFFQQAESPVNFTIYASDSSSTVLERARAGVYQENELRNIPISRLKRWFTKTGEVYKISPLLQKRIVFTVFNLIKSTQCCPPECIFCEFDIIICSNILFYHKKKYRNIIIGKLFGSINENGYIITGETEREFFLEKNIPEIIPRSGIFQIINKNQSLKNVQEN